MNQKSVFFLTCNHFARDVAIHALDVRALKPHLLNCRPDVWASGYGSDFDNFVMKLTRIPFSKQQQLFKNVLRLLQSGLGGGQ